MFTTEALTLVVVAFVLAIPLALLLRGISTSTLRTTGMEGPFVVPIGAFAVIALIAVVSGVIATWSPARRASRLVITETLRVD